jgi:hypothetical protein
MVSFSELPNAHVDMDTDTMVALEALDRQHGWLKTDDSVFPAVAFFAFEKQH